MQRKTVKLDALHPSPTPPRSMEGTESLGEVCAKQVKAGAALNDRAVVEELSMSGNNHDVFFRTSVVSNGVCQQTVESWTRVLKRANIFF
jgi:hypothetical protein